MKKTIRHQAVDILNAVSKSEAFAGDLLDACLDEQNLSGTADGRLLTHLVYGVLRQRGHLDWILSKLYNGKYTKMEENVKNILRTGLYQLKFSDRLPAFAVVDEAVKIAKKIAPAASGLTNAVLRGYLRDAGKIVFPDGDGQTADYIATFYSHPLWLVKTWIDIFGREETMALCRVNNEQPPLSLRVNTLKISRMEMAEKLQADGFDCEISRFSPDGINLTESPHAVQKTPFFKDGLLRIQDEAAQLVSYLVNPAEGENILDACAGSGGKTTHLAALMKNSGRIVAMDRDGGKLTQLKTETSRLGISIIETRPVDLCLPLPPGFSKKFDRVLIDAPCSGAGTLRRNPEIKWRLKQEDIAMFSGNQRLILNSAAEAVKKGGRLVYCTCSVLPHENDDVIRRFLADHSDFTIEPPSDSVPSRLMDTRGFLRTYPHRHTIDGFFGAILKRRI